MLYDTTGEVHRKCLQGKLDRERERVSMMKIIPRVFPLFSSSATLAAKGRSAMEVVVLRLQVRQYQELFPSHSIALNLHRQKYNYP